MHPYIGLAMDVRTHEHRRGGRRGAGGTGKWKDNEVEIYWWQGGEPKEKAVCPSANHRRLHLLTALINIGTIECHLQPRKPKHSSKHTLDHIHTHTRIARSVHTYASERNRVCWFHVDCFFWQPLGLDLALVNRLVTCTWLLSCRIFRVTRRRV